LAIAEGAKERRRQSNIGSPLNEQREDLLLDIESKIIIINQSINHLQDSTRVGSAIIPLE
jgi:hypothetical protein